MEQQDDEIVPLFFILSSGDASISGQYLTDDSGAETLTNDAGTSILTP